MSDWPNAPFLQSGQVIPEQDEGEGHGVFVVHGAASEELPAGFNRLEQVIGAVDNIEVAHEQDLCPAGLRQGPERRNTVDVLAVINGPAVFEG